MTSTNIFSGKDEGRNSSRVLRPPGGGHTDVLGVGPAPEAPQARRPNPRNISSITEGTNAPTPINPNVVEAPRIEAPEKKEAVRAPPAASEAPPAQGQRVRVPPGGFSSGLW